MGGQCQGARNFMYRTAVISGTDNLMPPADGIASAAGTEQAPYAAKVGRMKDVERDLIIKTLRRPATTEQRLPMSSV